MGLVAALLAAGCRSPGPSVGFTDANQREQAMSAFRAGRAQLDCGIDATCLPRWFGQRDPATRQMHGNRRQAAREALASQNWHGLAETVLSSGIDTDLTWYYLGVAASGMGLTNAARVYFQRSVQRSRDRGMACDNVIPCDNIALPRQAQAMLAAAQPQRPRLVAQPAPAADGSPAAAAAAAAAAATPASTAAAAAIAPSNWVRPVVPPPEATGVQAPPAWVMPPNGRR